jgi:hypothetical protein
MRASIGRRLEGRCWGRRSMCEGLHLGGALDFRTIICSRRRGEGRSIFWREAATAAECRRAGTSRDTSRWHGHVAALEEKTC